MVEVGGFSGVGGEVVELGGGVGGGVLEGVLFEFPAAPVVAAGALVVEVLPFAVADGEGEGSGLVEGVVADRLLGIG